MQFTNDTSKVLTSIYKIYLERRKDGKSKEESKRFDENFYKETKVLSNWIQSDVSDSVNELHRCKFVKKNVIGGFTIEDALIIQMENRFKSGISEITKYLADLAAGITTGLIF